MMLAILLVAGGIGCLLGPVAAGKPAGVWGKAVTAGLSSAAILIGGTVIYLIQTDVIQFPLM